MLADFFRYFSARLALSYCLFMLSAFGVMYFGEGKAYPDYFLYLLLLISFIAASAILSRIGRWRFNALMVDAQECDITRYYRKGEVLFEKLLILTNSFHFLPITAEHLRERVYKEYSRFLLALDAKSKKTLWIHKKAYEYGWENSELKAKLVAGFKQKKNLEKDEIAIGIKLVSENRQKIDFIDLLVENCLSKNIKDYDAQEVYRQALNKNSRHIPQILETMLPGVLNMERGDPFAIELYFQAVKQTHRLRGRCRSLLCKLARPYLLDKDLGEQEKKLVDFYRSMTEKGGSRLQHQIGLDAGSASYVAVKADREKSEKLGANKIKRKTGQKAGPHRSEWRALLVTNTTFFYIFAGISLLLYFTYPSYQEKPTSLKEIPEPLQPQAPKIEEVKTKEIRKFVPFKSDYAFTIQVGAYNSMVKAETVMNELRKESNAVYWLPAKIVDKMWYRVRIGEFKDQDSARSFAQKLEEKKVIGKDYYLTNFKEGFILNEDYREVEKSRRGNP